MRRHEAREYALQALFAVDVGKADPVDAVRHVLEEERHVSEADEAYVMRLVNGTTSSLSDIDQLLSQHVEGWNVDRIGRVEMSVLRLAIYELREEQDVDFATIVDEAVQLTKSFSDEAAGRFVNGVLAKVGSIRTRSNEP